MVTLRVTASLTNPYDSVILKVWVVTNGTEAGGAVISTGGWATPTFSMTPEASGSKVVEGIFGFDSATAIIPAANNAADDSGLSAMGFACWDGHYTGTVTDGTPISLGGTDNNSWNVWAGYEIIPDGSVAIDASSPAAVVGTTSSAQTAEFTPPGSSVLVSIILSNGSAAQSITVSDNSGLGLSWTPRGTPRSIGYQGTCAVYTTTIPSGFKVDTESLPDATQGSAYSEALAASGGTEPYLWVLDSGSLPDGLVLS